MLQQFFQITCSKYLVICSSCQQDLLQTNKLVPPGALNSSLLLHHLWRHLWIWPFVFSQIPPRGLVYPLTWHLQVPCILKTSHFNNSVAFWFIYGFTARFVNLGHGSRRIFIIGVAIRVCFQAGPFGILQRAIMDGFLFFNVLYFVVIGHFCEMCVACYIYNLK